MTLIQAQVTDHCAIAFCCNKHLKRLPKTWRKTRYGKHATECTFCELEEGRYTETREFFVDHKLMPLEVVR